MRVKELKKYLSKLNPDAVLYVCIEDVRDTQSDYCPVNGWIAQNVSKSYRDGVAIVEPDYSDGSNAVVLYVREVSL